MGRAVDQHDIVVARPALDLRRDSPAGDRGDIDVRPGLPPPLAPQAEPGGEARLRVDVDDRNAPSRRRPGERQMRGQRRLAGAALLLCDGDDVGWHGHSPARVRSRAIARDYIALGDARRSLLALCLIFGHFSATRAMTLHLSSADLDEAARLLRRGELVAFPTETVYGLGGDATNDRAVAAIFAAKDRPRFNPLIVHVAELAEAEALAALRCAGADAGGALLAGAAEPRAEAQRSRCPSRCWRAPGATAWRCARRHIRSRATSFARPACRSPRRAPTARAG